ncbi:MAG: hypothetical protein ABS81_10075 [Pseudonocardia sp. SCN 72-86]|nr:MAG: hypothetical protein ABS81_10075 [Pseudonocardia sp. SCN 72-86]
MQALAGHPGAGLRRVPDLAIRAMGLVDPTARALWKMRYLFAEPFVVDSTKITRRLGLTATVYDRGLELTLAATPAPAR